MKKILKIIGCLSVLLIANGVNASSGYTFSVGTNYCGTDIDTATHATYVHNVLTGFGYTTQLLTSPTYATLTSQFSGGRKRLESDIMYFAGKGDSTSISWNYCNYGGIYAQALKNNATGSSTPTFTYTGIGLYNMNNVDLAIFQASNTANGNNNIAYYTRMRGAKTTMGWQTIVAVDEAYQYMTYFLGRVQAGYTIGYAMNYADNAYYLDGGVKYSLLYGSYNYRIDSANLLSTGNAVQSMSHNTDKVEDLKIYDINEKVINEKEVETQIEKLIIDRFDKTFDINNFYVQKIQTEQKTIYDIYLNTSGFKTNVGYTVIIKDGVIKTICDNTNGFDYKEILANKADILKEKAETFDREKYEKEALYQMKEEEPMTKLKKEKDILSYDAKEDKAYYNVYVTSIDSIFGTSATNTKKFEI